MVHFAILLTGLRNALLLITILVKDFDTFTSTAQLRKSILKNCKTKNTFRSEDYKKKRLLQFPSILLLQVVASYTIVFYYRPMNGPQEMYLKDAVPIFMNCRHRT